MNPITSLYKLLFGRTAMADGDVINMAEHGRVGGISTGQPFKFTSTINPDTGASTDDSLMLLRDIRKLLKASAYKDVGDRQIVKIGALGGISGGAEVTTTVPVSGSVTATVASTAVTALNGLDTRMQLFGQDRIKYAVGMRANLAFT